MFGWTILSTRAIFSGRPSAWTVTGAWYQPCRFVSLEWVKDGADIVCWCNDLPAGVLELLVSTMTLSLNLTVGVSLTLSA